MPSTVFAAKKSIACLARLGQHTTGKGCLYLKRVDQADPQALRDIVDRSYRVAMAMTEDA